MFYLLFSLDYCAYCGYSFLVAELAVSADDVHFLGEFPCDKSWAYFANDLRDAYWSVVSTFSWFTFVLVDVYYLAIAPVCTY